MDHTAIQSESRIAHFPIMFFAVVMGFGGISIAYFKAHEVLGIPLLVFEGLRALTSLLFLVIFSLYTIKFLINQAGVKKEFSHPIRINFFAAFSIALLLLAIIWKSVPSLGGSLFWLGAGVHTFLTFYTVSFWINNNFEITHSNPAWFIPIVGNLIVPVAGDGMASATFLGYYFAIGIFFWVVLFTVVFYRIIFHNQLPQKFMPTLFIFIAPPAVGFLAYLKVGGGFDLLAQFLLNLALFFAFLLLFMYKNFMKLQFFISWWAFTFPMAALTIALLVAYEKSHEAVYLHLGELFLLFATLLVAGVSVKTLRHIYKREICVIEE
ncbi:MAG: C4-dicarboxylate ABC transporter [Wolinella succinogenes]|uniref:SLAC1 anion channel family protein n=1 Tax=Wolinella succinogenes TaxID=844 RepID=UPI0016A35444|nr:SLAC1 anion channel family protein [Wolinella succinogenes]NLU33403.1 C4-dicarboxylate ABC transporter [Wolinella succinogenes]